MQWVAIETPSLHFVNKMDKAFSIARNAMGGHRNPFFTFHHFFHLFTLPAK